MSDTDLDNALADLESAPQDGQEVISDAATDPGQEVTSSGAGEGSDSRAQGDDAKQGDPAGEKTQTADAEVAEADATIQNMRERVLGGEKATKTDDAKAGAKPGDKPAEGKDEKQKPADDKKAAQKPALKPEEERYHPAAKATITALRSEVHAFEQQIRELKAKAKDHDTVTTAAETAGLNTKYVGHVVHLHGKAINGDQKAQQQVFNLLVESGFKAPASDSPAAANVDLDALENAVTALEKGETLDLSLVKFIIAQGKKNQTAQKPGKPQQTEPPQEDAQQIDDTARSTEIQARENEFLSRVAVVVGRVDRMYPNPDDRKKVHTAIQREANRLRQVRAGEGLGTSPDVQLMLIAQARDTILTKLSKARPRSPETVHGRGEGERTHGNVEADPDGAIARMKQRVVRSS